MKRKEGLKFMFDLSARVINKFKFKLDSRRDLNRSEDEILLANDVGVIFTT